ncbi:hypothetical protein [Polyangium jinanense]|uniref:Outer membrane protein beta-barrel domain-containing protein n=1 Tax=Polyangium jinanense TaxID=2829994 RepID=A0A9X3XCQ0_9BACT|nr:hypothetical protein [Polyangium jinanense]MDC3961748.1 hypothetical protein [Polyangium jinanense]MDC3988254.1 hypothetical protein [Polyangium jinanense]
MVVGVRRTRARWRIAGALVCLLGFPSLARAADEPPPAPTQEAAPRGELFVAVSSALGTTDWRTDVTGYGGFAVGLRLFGIVTPFAEGRLGYGTVDQRLLTFLSLGVRAGWQATPRVYPRAHVGFVHQHEESMASVAEEPFGAVLGIGPGIRHRAGVQFGLGCDFTLLRRSKFTLALGPELVGAYLGYSSGPNLYGFVGANLGAHFALF